MARAVKKETLLTPEEKLAQALVPVAEQPYQVPANWCWTKWGEAGEFIAGNGFKNEYQGFTEYEIPFFKVGSLKYSDANGYIYDGSNTINEEIRLKLKASLIPPNSVLFAKIGEAIRLNRRSINEIACCIDNNMMAFVPKCLMRYAFYWSCGIDLYDYTNATTVPAIRKSDLEAIPFPYAPLAEQQRIVDQIESLFAKLDEVKEKAQAVVDGYENRKAAILHKAFTGELTEQWRTSKDLSRDSWRHVTVKDVCHDIKVGIVIKPSQYYTDKENGTHAFRSANVREFHIDDFDWVFLNEQGMETNQRCIVHTGDVLVVRSGNPGTACVVEEKYDGYNAIDILIAVPNREVITSDFLCAFTNSPMGRNLVTENKRGMALAHFNVSGYSKLKMELPSISEQKVITTTLFSLLDNEKQAEETAEQVIVQIDTMKKSILARAFRGELGTNDPADESAEELLKRLL